VFILLSLDLNSCKNSIFEVGGYWHHSRPIYSWCLSSVKMERTFTGRKSSLGKKWSIKELEI